METINVLCRRNRFENLALVDMVGQRKLNQNTIYAFIVIEFIDQRQQLRFTGFSRQFVLIGKNPALFAGLFLHRNIDPAGRIITDQNDRQPGCYIPVFQIGYVIRNCPAQILGNLLSINNFCHNFFTTPFEMSSQYNQISRVM